MDIYCFPALYRAAEKLDTGALTLNEGEACCYEHASKRAASLCSNCGRFLCALCEVRLGQQILCPDCLNGQKAGRQRDTLDTNRTKYDSVALALATWPVLTIYFVLITAPLAFIMAIFAWKRPTSIVRRSRWRIYAALTLSSLEVVGMVAFVVFLVTQVKGKLQ